jgi:hypothetical protein
MTLFVQPETRIGKSTHNGITAKSYAQLTIDGKRAQLSIETSKTNYPRGDITTKATIGWISEDNIGVSHALYSDFYKIVERTTARATEKSISTLHAKALERYDSIVVDAMAYYAARQTSEV